MTKRKFSLLLLILLVQICGIVSAQEEDEQGEGDRVRKREEWFYSSRRAGATDRLNEQRWKGVLHTKEMMRLQRLGHLQKMASVSSWVSMGPSPSTFGDIAWGNVAGRVIALAKDSTNNILYAGAASGGLWKSTNDGTTWTSIFDSVGTLTIGAIALDPNNPQILWAGTGENTMGCESYFGTGLWRSTDGGANWEQRNGTGANTLNNLAMFANIVIDPANSNHVLVGGYTRQCGGSSSAGLYSTTDAGANWTTEIPDGSITSIAHGGGNVYWAARASSAGVGNEAGLWRSTDGGNTWSLQTASGLPNGNYVGNTKIAVAPSNNNYVYVLFGYPLGGGSQLWRTTNGGTTWTQMASGSNACDGQCWYNMVLRVHNSNPDTLIRGNVQLYKSTDGGSSWADLIGSNQKVHPDIQELLMDPADSNTFYIGCDGGVWKTTDGGNNFTNLNGNLNITQFYALGNHPTDNNTIMGGAQDNASLIRTTSNVWQLQLMTFDGFVCHFDPANPDIVYVATYPFSGPRIFRSTSGAFGPFEFITSNVVGPSAWVTPYILDPSNPGTLFVGTNRIWRSTNNGSNWAPVGPSDMGFFLYDGIVHALEVNRSNGNYVFSGTTDGMIWRSTDGGTNWTEISGFFALGTYINDIASDPANPARAFAVVGGFGTAHLWEHTGSGDWIARGNGLPDVPANTVFIRTTSEIYVGTDVGIYVSTNGGVDFVPFMDGLPQGLVITDLKYTANTQTLMAGTYGRGAWEYVFPVPDCSSPDAAITIGNQVNSTITCAAQEAGWKYYSVNIPNKPYALSVDLSNLSADADVYVRFGSKPNLTSYDCRDLVRGTGSEQCSIPGSQAGTWWIGINNFDTGAINYSLLISYAEGGIQGTVRKAATSDPIEGATVTVGASQATTDATGFYEIAASAGPKSVTVDAYSYLPKTVNDVIVPPPAGIVTQDFALETAPLVTVSGVVTDGSGQGWPLYAKIDITEHPAGPVYTNPVTGYYSVQLYKDNKYTFHVSAVSPGYDPESRPVTAADDLDQDFSLTVDSSCEAPGYATPNTIFFENFDAITSTQCAPQGGGLLVGNVLDGNTGDGINGSKVEADAVQTDSAISFATPDDPNVPDGMYILWSSLTGAQSFTATSNLYNSSTQSPVILTNTAVAQNFTLSTVPTCLFCDPFDDGTLDATGWTYKGSWAESGGLLSAAPLKVATAIATPAFGGCVNCSIETSMRTSGGEFAELWLFGWYKDKLNLVELLFKPAENQVILKQRIGKVVAKKNASFTITPNTFYQVTMRYDGINIVVSIDGVDLITMVPVGTLPAGSVGFGVKASTGSFDFISVE